MKRGGWLRRKRWAKKVSLSKVRASVRRRAPKASDEFAMDRIDRAACLRRADYHCEKCHERFPESLLERHHIISRGCKALRHVADNHLCLCRRHHNWWHRVATRLERESWLESLWPGRMAALLEARRALRRLMYGRTPCED